MAAAMAFYVQVIGFTDEMEERAKDFVQNFRQLLTPDPINIGREKELCERAQEDVKALRLGLQGSELIPLTFFTVFEQYVLNFDCTIVYTEDVPLGQ